MSVAAKVKLLPFELEVVSGPHLGQKFSFVDLPSITIGRGTENNICLQHDPRVSRVHVEIRQDHDVIHIINKTEKNTLLVNGRQETQFKVLQNCVFSLGETEIKFIYPQKPNKNPLQPLAQSPVPVGLVQPSQSQQNRTPGPVLKNPPPSTPLPPTYASPQPMSGGMGGGMPQAPKRRKPVKKSEGFNPILLIIVVAAILAVVFIFPSKNEDAKTPEKQPDIVAPVYKEEQRYK